MSARPLELRFRHLLVAVAALVLLDGLLLTPVLVVAFTQPALLWLALGPYLALSFGFTAGLIYLLYRWGALELQGPWAYGLSRYLIAVILLTGGFLAVVALRTEWAWPSLALWLLLMTYATYRLLRWQVETLAFQCGACGQTFPGSMITWLGSPNLGSRKYVTCRYCGKATWAKIVARGQA